MLVVVLFIDQRHENLPTARLRLWFRKGLRGAEWTTAWTEDTIFDSRNITTADFEDFGSFNQVWDHLLQVVE